MGALAVATTLVAALFFDEISSRTSVMSLGVILMCALSADRLDRAGV